jgi:Fuc2NAc and GlcNAc transferase
VTLAERVIRGERWYSGHRSHAYQWLSRRWGSHARVTGLLVLINTAIVLPEAWWSVHEPELGPGLALAVLRALGGTGRASGAGRPESAARTHIHDSLSASDGIGTSRANSVGQNVRVEKALK